MNISAPFAKVDVDFNRSTELALLLSAAAGVAVVDYGPLPSNSTSPSGLANDATAYTANIVVDGVIKAISIVGSAAQTFATLVTEINTDLAASAVATLVGGTIVITSAVAGPGSAVTVVDTGTFPLFASVKGKGYGLVSITTTKGNNKYLNIGRMDEVTKADVVSVIDAFLAAAPANTNVKWTHGFDDISLTPIGPATTVEAQTATGLAAGTYSINLAIDGGAAADSSFTIKAGTTFQTLVDDYINPAIASRGVSASIVPGAAAKLRFTSNSNGATSTVAVVAGTTGDLIAALAAFAAAVAAGTPGTDGTTDLAFPKLGFTNWEAVLNGRKGSRGYGPLFTAGVASICEKEDKPAAKGNAVRTSIYWDGTSWKFFGNDVTLGAAVNPPEL